MEADSSEFQDWEVLHHISEAEPEESSDFVGDSEGMIQTNYFSLDSLNKHIVSDVSEGSCKSLDNPSWIDQGFETQYPRKLSGVSLSDESSDRSDHKRLAEFEGKYDVGLVQNDQNGKFQEFEGKYDVGFVENEQSGNFQEFEGNPDVSFVQNDQNGNFGEFEGNPDVGFVENDQNGNFGEFEGNPDVGFVQNDQNGNFGEFEGNPDVGFAQNDQNGNFGEFEENPDVGFAQNDQNGNFGEGVYGVETMVAENDENSEKFSNDSSRTSSGELMVEGVEGRDELGVKKDEILGDENGEREASEEKGETEVSGVEEEKKKSGMVWWKFPIELLRYCVFKCPVWTFSVAAAFMGFVVLGRRLYKMKKKKSKDLGPRITMDDKKISQFISRAARLNEAFSVVKRVPIIRPILPAAGVTPWSVASLR